MASRWQCLTKVMLQTHTVVEFVCLHNLIRLGYVNLDHGQMDADNEAHNIILGAWSDESQMEEVEQVVGENIDNAAGKQQREYLSMYFCSGTGLTNVTDLH